MKISYNWLKDYLKDMPSPPEVSALLTSLGLEVESLAVWMPVKGGLEGLIIGEIESVAAHPQADRLRLLKVNIGSAEPLNIICGAANASENMKVVVAPVGTTLFPVNGPPVNIGRSKIRGVYSDGMLCSEEEVGLGESHEGIMELPPNAPVSQALSDFLGHQKDHIFEVGITPNRSDALSHRGVARDLAARLMLASSADYAIPFDAFIDLKQSEVPELTKPINLEVVLEDASCTRFSGVLIERITISESPEWLKQKLRSIDVKPVNSIVDVTNYVLHDMGQPLHAYDVEKIRGHSVQVGRPEAGWQLITLDGVQRTLHPDDLIIKDDQGALALAGVLGGLGPSVTTNTQKVFIESACFDSVAVRKTARRHGLNTDASFRFERGGDVEATIPALLRALELISSLNPAATVSGLIDIYPAILTPRRILLRRQKLDALIGHFIKDRDLRIILNGLRLRVLESKDGLQGHWLLEVPLYRVDVLREADIIEEVLRIYDFNNIPIPYKFTFSIPQTFDIKEERTEFASKFLAACGLTEIMNTSLVSASSKAALFETDPRTLIHLLNPLSAELDSMRAGMIGSGLKTIAYNQNRRRPDLRLFEFGKVYKKVDGEFVENEILAFFFSGLNDPAWDKAATAKKSKYQLFYNLKGLMQNFLRTLGLTSLLETPVESVNEVEAPTSFVQYEWKVGDRLLAAAGIVPNALTESHGIKQQVCYGEVYWDMVSKLSGMGHQGGTSVSKYPVVKRDLSFMIDDSVTFLALRSLAFDLGLDILTEVGLFDVFIDGTEKNKKSYGLTYSLQSNDHTLTESEIDESMQKLITAYEKAGISVRTA